jgi:folate-dependent phosphoribosylglycinamide formyltransferase PurN
MSATENTPRRAVKLVLLALRGDYGNMFYNALASRYAITAAVLEDRIGGWTLVRRRIKRLGVWKTLGQVAFRLGIAPLLAFGARARVAEIMHEHGLSTALIPAEKTSIIDVASVNSAECIAALARLAPDIVIVAGTRILGEATLAAAPDAVFVNVHAGITPLYRGVHGGYWALAENDAAHCGVTVHLVDKGIDTGGILAQALIAPTASDNFASYGLLQNVAGLALLRDKVLPRLIAGDRSTLPAPAGESRLWSHPTAWQYLRNRLSSGTK